MKELAPKRKATTEEGEFIDENRHGKGITCPEILLKVTEAWHVDPAGDNIWGMIREVRATTTYISALVAVIGYCE